MKFGNITKPRAAPSNPPLTVAIDEKIIYFCMMCLFSKPSDFNVPISVRSSSTIRFIEIKLTKTATAKKIAGNSFDRFLILFVSSI